MSDAQPVYILDSYAMLAYLGGEEGGEFVKEKLEEAQREESRLLMSLINLGEVLYISERRRG
ncbi:MAG: type II toxin-antitoxin system VapC family toxin, partial [Anaerolineae bacterium]|nr:type II toxin-antitoxin system VapC family toxin [Anaerolineae bacterium]